jgi:hypothetical protein
MDKYIKTVVDDEATFVTVDDNEALRKSNEVKKTRLKEAKEKLKERSEAVGELAEKVEESERVAFFFIRGFTLTSHFE